MAEGGGLLSRAQPITDTAEFSLFNAGFLQHVAQRAAAAVSLFVSPLTITGTSRISPPVITGIIPTKEEATRDVTREHGQRISSAS